MPPGGGEEFFMRKSTLLFFFCLVLSACSAARGEDRLLTVYTWENYFSPRAVALFEIENNCAVEFYYYDSNDTMVQQLGEGGGYDVITPSGMDSVFLREKDLLLPLDHGLLPNLKNIESGTPSSVHDREMRYSVPYTVTVTGIAYNKKMLPGGAPTSWALFGDPALRNRVTMLNDMREPLGAALRHLGHSVNSTDAAELDAAADQLIAWKKNIDKFSTDTAREGLRRGTYAAIQTYNGEFTLAAQFNGDLAFLVPEEGSMMNSDQLVIGADTESADLAHAFINFFLRPDVAAINMEDIYYVMPNTPALDIVKGRIRNSTAFFFPKEVLDRCEVVLNVGDGIDLYDRTWEKVLFSD